MMYWLQELQKRRRIYTKYRNSLSREKPGHFLSTKRPKHLGGLTSSSSAQEVNTETNLPDVSSNNSNNMETWTSPSSSVTNLQTEFQIAMPNIKRNNSGPRLSGEDWMVLDQPDVYVPPVVSPSHTTAKPQPQSRLRSAFRRLKKSPSKTEESTVLSPMGNVCHRCKQLENQLELLREEHTGTEDELQALREIVRLQQKELDHQRKEMETRRQSSVSDEVGLAEMMTKRDKHIIELEYCLATSNEEKAVLAQKNRTVQSELKTLQEQVAMFQQMLEAKDQIVMKLTNDIFKLEENNNHDGKPTTLPKTKKAENISHANPVDVQCRELERLKDVSNAYKSQHEFLTSEIVELNELRRNDEETIKRISMNLARTEADYCHIKSKYLYLLKELKEPMRGGDEASQDIVNQLLEEALESDDTEEVEYHLTSSGQEHDRYGFVKKYHESISYEENDPLVLEAQKLERKSEEANTKLKQADEVVSHQVKWENFMVGILGKPLVRSPELKLLIRSGIPHEHREFIWKGCVSLVLGDKRDKLGPNFYRDMVSKTKHTSLVDPASKQIELDLLRTLPNNKHYDSIDSEGINKLRNVLMTYNFYNPTVGYCQGMNRLVAIILLFLSEEETFWCLVAIIEYIMPADYYSKTLLAAQADQRVLKDLIQEKMPRLYYHFDSHGVDISLFTFNWFLTIFVDNIPTETFLRIWDSFLYEGSKVLFRFALAFFKCAEEEILKADGPLALNHYMRVMGEKMTDIQQISHVAFHTVNPFPMRSISSKRQVHLQQVRNELEELDRIRADLNSQREVQNRGDYCSDDELES